MADTTPPLKRKAEEAPAKKRSKKRRPAEKAGQPTGATDAQSTPRSHSTPILKNASELNSNVVQTNGVSKEQRKKDKKSGTIVNEELKDGGKQVEDSEVQSTPARRISQPQQSDRSKQKKEKKDSNPENKADSTELVKVAMTELDRLLGSSPTQAKKPKPKTLAKWTMSPAQGGWFLPADPVFSRDEKFVILANLRSLQIYETETSTLANVLSIGSTGVLTAYALSPTKPNQVYVADSTGLITLWDWVDGSKIGRWDIGATVRTMTVITRPESNEDLIYCYEHGKSHVINVHALRTKAQGSKTDLKRVLKASSSISGIQVLLQGKYVVVACTDSIMIAKRLRLNKTAVQDFEYIWRELKFSKRITTFNAYLRDSEQTGKGKKSAQDQRDVLDIAVGDEAGVILLFEDILTTFAAIESTQKGNKSNSDDAESLRPKRLHWHRDAVGAVKWSLDGNYLVSGGDETVLTIWQLATGKPQHLPHLTAAIENVVVSPSGSAYAVTLANNSVIVLSTTELEAKTNIVGIQSRRVDYELFPKDSNSSKALFDIYRSVPMAVNPKSPGEVLFSVPSSQWRQRTVGLRPEPYLQTFDLANHRAKSRQALTRNNATDVNMAPEGGRIIEPSVQLLQVSHDGEWLATVDEWVPPQADTGYLNEGITEFNDEERLHRREVYLKIWQWDEQNQQWKLGARIDAPHFFEDVCGNGRVFDLVADPSAAGFATIGEDRVVRIWRPKTRLRDGIVVRGAEEGGLVTWSLDRSIEISDKLDVLEGSQQSLVPRTSRLAFSADGSIIAAAISWPSESDPGVTHLIDTNTATIRRSMTEIDVTALSGLGIVGRHLVVIADTITVWDMVVDQLVYSVSVVPFGIDRFERIPLVRFAINEADGTFCVALPQFERNESSNSRLQKTSSKVLIFDPESREALWSHTAPYITLALVSQKGERGYIALDSKSCIKTISPRTGALQLPTPPPEGNDKLQRTMYTGEDEGEEKSENGILKPLVLEDLSQDIQEGGSFLNQQDLQDVLDNGSVPPPPQGLFSAVLALVGRASKAAA
ncbi:WD40 repeat-like protein [Cucurbitaria berberidis CBS 394.84]|uniref:WD40 repeat-like protein n=1 Tax=Cucurbitaria berberidis CBS 394.84 TaxID=1168544 RepID=A0A9P4GC24_9PLEO|nr:WD40 repeat-like protein [Cucurbitaria berberidis CBS 394.84]KAF1842455.1 WD40 repeat-like protein [Cucurbitaria berberidis CBS 394.84]